MYQFRNMISSLFQRKNKTTQIKVSSRVIISSLPSTFVRHEEFIHDGKEMLYIARILEQKRVPQQV